MIAMALYEWLPGIITAIFSGGIGASIVAWYKVPAERGQIVVTAAQGALIVQTGVMTLMRQDLERVSNDNKTLRNQVEFLTKENNTLKELIDNANLQIEELKHNQGKHDGEIKELRNNNT